MPAENKIAESLKVERSTMTKLVITGAQPRLALPVPHHCSGATGPRPGTAAGGSLTNPQLFRALSTIS
jgi:hypothetical protein